jgi:RNA polymerase sigma-70 factor, ECF subfamily
VSVDYLLADTADRDAGPLIGRLRRRTAVVRGDDAERAVARAVARAKQGDAEAVRFLYVRYADNVYGYVRSIVRDDHEAEDVTQHVFAKLITIIGRYEQRSVPFWAWILRIARNVAVDHLRRARAVPFEEVRSGADGLDESPGDRARSLGEALGTLSDDQRDVLVLRHLVGLSPLEIAERLGRSEGSVHGLHHRGRRALQVELRSMGVAPSTSAA